MNDEFCFLSAADLRGRISRKQISPLEVTKAVVARAERTHGVGVFLPRSCDGFGDGGGRCLAQRAPLIVAQRP